MNQAYITNERLGMKKMKFQQTEAGMTSDRDNFSDNAPDNTPDNVPDKIMYSSDD